MERYTGNLLNYPFTVTIQRSHKKGESDKKRILCEDIFTFDIETTSYFYDIDRKPYLYEKGKDPEYWAGTYAGALPYIWQFGINDRYYYGRDLKDFYTLLDDFPPDMHVRIAVHNLPFEWHFLDRLTWTNVFAKTPHKPITASCAEHPNIQFYCTYSLTNRSLESWGEYLGVPKLVGFLDYNQMRTPYTKLDPKEFEYAERDLKVMYEGIKDELKVYKSVWKLPLTSTGKVRRIGRDLLMEDEDYRKYIKRLIPPDPYQYHTSLFCFAGGYTHANRIHAGHILYNDDGEHGQHVDYTSDYPMQMVFRKYPCSHWAYVPDKVLPDPATYDTLAYKVHAIFYGIECQTYNTYIPCSKAGLVDPQVDNGRLISAESCDIWMTEQDLDIIMKTYTWKEVKVLEVWKAGKDYLPLPYVKFILELFRDKTVLKGIDDAETALKKGYLNSLFGLMVTALLASDVIWDTETKDWHIKRVTDEMISEHLEKLRRPNDKRYFLNFDWGVWVCAYGRNMIWNDIIIPYDKYVAYADTDSAFLTKKVDWTEYNLGQDEKLRKVCELRGLDFEQTRPRNKKGKQSFLGRLTIEEEWTEFKALGAKRYCERWKSDGKLHLTVAGINKGAVSCLQDDIRNFKSGLVFDKDEDDVNKLLHTYIDNMPNIVFPDGYISTQRRGVNLRPNGYRLTLDKTYADLIGEISTGHINEQFENHLKSSWFDDIDELINYALTGVIK